MSAHKKTRNIHQIWAGETKYFFISLEQGSGPMARDPDVALMMVASSVSRNRTGTTEARGGFVFAGSGSGACII